MFKGIKKSELIAPCKIGGKIMGNSVTPFKTVCGLALAQKCTCTKIKPLTVFKCITNLQAS